ncbi:hypothetical protein [Microcystis aeruginosa]|uniref:hypothetical protein n=1 Tax=Microcystis aeruginosa TaxID=1126 RepID=UPI001EE6A2C4|nr:hypothetical protein [Microcystis aeruginosa]
MKSILVATIGTRDLMFQVTTGDWYNIGDDRMKGDILGEQIEVVSDLALTEKSSFREISQYLWENIEYYGDQVKPVILGKLLEDKIGSSLPFMLNQQTRCQDNILLTQKFRKFLKP